MDKFPSGLGLPGDHSSKQICREKKTRPPSSKVVWLEERKRFMSLLISEIGIFPSEKAA